MEGHWSKSFLVFTLILAWGCDTEEKVEITAPLFTTIEPNSVGIYFENTVSYTEDFNPYLYRNFYNGGGVGIGDINNDDLPDLFFCGNMVDNHLYLNKGDFRFEDITEKAGVASASVWSSGVSMVDINGDGWLDIYVCKSGNPGDGVRHNELFINNGDLTFSERAEAYGINDKGLSTHAAFFDFDRDGDLDCYLLNNSFTSIDSYNLNPDQRMIRDPQGGNKLYRNDNGYFNDVSEQAGIYGSSIGFGLGVSIGDVNRDGWQDIYVSNDFFEKDYLYMNNHDGTFTEDLESQIKELSLGSMGADMADINNDGFLEIFVTEMLPRDEARLKTKSMFEPWEKHILNIQNGYYRQFARNVLQLNNGINTLNGKPFFSEIGRFSGVEATDWSWGALIMDLDNDGWKDLFVANGIYKDLLDQDYLNFMADPATVREILKKEKSVLTKLVDAMPSEPLSNYAFKNNGDLTFTDNAQVWGLGSLGFSNGSAYGDLDNDGDLDLVVNNVNMPPYIYRSEVSQISGNHYLTLHLKGDKKNSGAIGSQVTLWSGDDLYYQELVPSRGFESTMDARLHFGLGTHVQVDSMTIRWPDGKLTTFLDVKADKQIKINQNEVETHPEKILPKGLGPYFQDITDQLGIDYTHVENDFVDFGRNTLLYHMKSTEGPALATGDINGDGFEDFYVGGAKDFPGVIYVQDGTGKFRSKRSMAIENDRISEDTDAVFFDVDGDSDLDLYVTSGGNEFSSSSIALQDRLYLNDGTGEFTKSDQALPEFKFISTSVVRPSDYDEDGDIDLFVGARLRPFLYGVPVNGYLLNNDGQGYFKNVTPQYAPGLNEVGMITDMTWGDYDNDGDEDIILAGEWMPVKIFSNNDGRFEEVTESAGLAHTNGLWNSIQLHDFDADGDLDMVAGNLGLNTRIRASIEKPATMYVNDFDGNGKAEHIICTFNGDLDYPMVMRDDLIRQVPTLQSKYPKHELYKEQRITDIFSPQILERSVKLQLFTTATSIFINNGNGTFEVLQLPREAQFAPIYSLYLMDYNQDGHVDILLGGNLYNAKPEVGIYDATYGLMFKGNTNMDFTYVPNQETGFFVNGQIRKIRKLKGATQTILLVARNDDDLMAFDYQKNKQ